MQQVKLVGLFLTQKQKRAFLDAKDVNDFVFRVSYGARFWRRTTKLLSAYRRDNYRKRPRFLLAAVRAGVNIVFRDHYDVVTIIKKIFGDARDSGPEHISDDKNKIVMMLSAFAPAHSRFNQSVLACEAGTKSSIARYRIGRVKAPTRMVSKATLMASIDLPASRDEPPSGRCPRATLGVPLMLRNEG